MEQNNKNSAEKQVLVFCKIDQSWNDLLEKICENECRTKASLLKQAIKKQIVEANK